MKINAFEIFALTLCSCLFGIILSAYNMSVMVTEREIMLVSALYVTVVIFLYIQQYNQDALVQYLSHHKSEIENRQVADLQEAHRRRILSLKTEHNFDKHQLQGSLNVAIAKFDRLNGEYDWMSDAYQDQIRSLQEQEDRINYLEVKLHELGQTSPTMRQPFSAPPSQIRFANPPRRQHGAGAPSPLNQVVKADETENEENEE